MFDVANTNLIRHLLTIVKPMRNCKRQNIVGSSVPSKAPIVGMKFKREIKNAQNIAKFNPKDAKTM